MRLVFRVDSSIRIGSGHVMRCLSLADRFRDEPAEISFVCRDLEGNLCDYIKQKGYVVHKLQAPERTPSNGNIHNPGYADWLGVSWQQDSKETLGILSNNVTIDWLIVDHYALDIRWESELIKHVKHLMVIDDLINRTHNCDVLLNQNYSVNKDQYINLVPDSCKKLLGADYVLLRSEFSDLHKRLRRRDGKILSILIYFGGADPTNETLKAINAILLLNQKNIEVDVIVGFSNPYKGQLSRLCENRHNFKVHQQVSNMAELMQKADLCLGAAGTSTWERCAMALPSILISIAENQVPIASAVHDKGAAIYLGDAKEVTVSRLSEAIQSLLDDPARVAGISKQASTLVDGKGTDRAFKAMNRFL